MVPTPFHKPASLQGLDVAVAEDLSGDVRDASSIDDKREVIPSLRPGPGTRSSRRVNKHFRSLLGRGHFLQSEIERNSFVNETISSLI